MRKGKKPTYEEVKEYIESFGYKLLSTEYKNNNTKLLVQCDKGHKYEVTFNSFKNHNSRCPHCKGLAKHTYEEVKNYIESFGYKLLSNEYKNTKTKLLVQCDKGHMYETGFNSFQMGRRCPHCSKYRKRYTYEEVKEYIESFGYTLLSNECANVKDKLLVRCPKGHEYKVTFSSFKNDGSRCRICYHKENGKKNRNSYEEVKEYIESFGYKLLSTEYIDNKQKLLVKCPNPSHNSYEVSFNKFSRGRRCPECKMTKGEQEILNWLNKNNIKYIYDKEYFEDLLSPLGNPLKPDFILPDYKIWIEYDGVFHFEKQYDGDGHEKLQIHDEIKNQYANKYNWKLIRIPYWDFDRIEEILEKEINKKEE